MATLQRIRSKAGVLVVVFIGFALFAFIMTDLLSSGNSLFQRSKMNVAEIDGNSVTIQEFQEKVSQMEEYAKLNSGQSTLDEDMVYRLREQTWNQMVNEVVMGEKYQEVGIDVTSEELLDMVTGKNIHPTIRQLFTNPQTGTFDQEQVMNFLRSKKYDPNANFYWNFVEQQINSERHFSKYASLIKKGFYVPALWTDTEVEARKKEVDFDFIIRRLTSVSDSAVSVSEKEISNYYNNNTDKFKQEASRDVEYITFDVVPTEGDKELARERIEEMKADFESADVDPLQFVRLNSDIPFVDRYFKPGALDPQISDFVTHAKPGEVYGTYFEDETFKLTRLVAVAELPDSVKARHILLRSENAEAANSLADSLMTLLKKGANFSELARTYSQDQGSAINGGDLGWFGEGMMVKPFSDAAFFGKKGDLVKVESQFGIHLINIQDQSKPSTKYQLATLGRKVTYSSKTYQDVYSEATRFTAVNNTREKFEQGLEEENITRKYGRGLQKNDRTVGALESPRELVKWAFGANVGDLSPIFEFGDQFVVALLTQTTEAGTMPLNAVHSRISRELINDKKAEILIAQFNKEKENGKTFETIAQNMETEILSTSNVGFGSYQITGAGVEPALVALAVYTPEGSISQPIRGNNGVYMVQVKSQKETESDPFSVKAQLQNDLNMKVDYQLLETIREKAEVEDNRANFY